MSETYQLNRTASHSRFITLFLGMALFLPGVSSAQDTDAESVHWAYAAFLGTGWYKLDSNRQVYVLRIPPRWYFRDSSIVESGKRQLGIEFHFPLTFGLHKLEQLDDFIDIDNIGTVSFNPGVEIEYPISNRWHLRAYGHFGWGKNIESNDRAWIYDAGLKSRFSFQNGNLDWAVVNELFFAGYNAKKTDEDSLGGMMAGLDFSYPIGSGSGTALKLNWDVLYRWYENDLSFPRTSSISQISSVPVSVEDEWEIGVAIARQDGPIKIWFLDFQHLGLIYRFNTDGSFRAFTVNFRAPFTR
jgi:hypothetical protein